jgi:hypothetical protein
MLTIDSLIWILFVTSKSCDRAWRINTDVLRIEPMRAHHIRSYVNTVPLTVFLRASALHPGYVGVVTIFLMFNYVPRSTTTITKFWYVILPLVPYGCDTKFGPCHASGHSRRRSEFDHKPVNMGFVVILWQSFLRVLRVSPVSAIPPMTPIYSKRSPHIHITSLRSYFTITVPLPTKSIKWSLSLSFPSKFMYVFFSPPVCHTFYPPHPLPPTRFYRPNDLVKKTIYDARHARFPSSILCPS